LRQTHSVKIIPKRADFGQRVLFESPSTPRFQIHSDYLWRSFESADYHVHVVRSAIDRVAGPHSTFAGFTNLDLDELPQLLVQNLCGLL
jgi:hypothetical protein